MSVLRLFVFRNGNNYFVQGLGIALGSVLFWVFLILDPFNGELYGDFLGKYLKLFGPLILTFLPFIDGLNRRLVRHKTRI